jgi:hypothetical protein
MYGHATADGLTLDDGRRLPWSDVHSVEWAATGAWLVTAAGVVYVSRDSGEFVERQIGSREAQCDAETGELRAEVIEHWLGVGTGGALRCRLSPWAIWGSGLAFIAALACFVFVEAKTHFMLAFMQLLVFPLLTLAGMLRSARSVDADAKGLSVRRGRRREYFAWSEIETLRRRKYDWVITTSRGSLTLAHAAKGQDKVTGIIQRLLSMKKSGAVLPSAAPTPESALSLARLSGPEAGERGLSVSHDE